MAGLPAMLGDKPLHWAKDGLEPGQCACCGRLDENEDVILCGTCSLILSDAAGPQRVVLTPEERLALVRRQRRQKGGRR